MEITEPAQVNLLGRWRLWGEKTKGSDRSETSVIVLFCDQKGIAICVPCT